MQVDSQNNELVIGIVGRPFQKHRVPISDGLRRLHPYLYLGQETRELGQGVSIFRRGW